MIKKKVNKLKITKNKKATDSNGQFSYVFDWYNDDEMVLQEVRKLMADIYNIPIENFDIADLIDHKKHCCMDIEAINIEEVEI
jgi:hypothetical protein